MKLFNDSVTLGLGALGVAMFSLGFSVTGVACNVKPGREAPTEQPPAARHALPKQAVSVPEIVIAPSTATSAESARGPLRIKRLVVTERIVEREPVATETLSTSRGPIYAFAELENTSSDRQTIEITFEHEDKRLTVGHAELEVPANRSRFRTWGNTRNIREPGRWHAIVKTADGQELARTEFDVESS